MDQGTNSSHLYEPEFSFKQVIKGWLTDLKYLLRFKKLLALAALTGLLLGALLAWKWPVTYTARLTFVVDDSKSTGAGGLAALAGQLGFNMDGIGGGSGVLAGDNVQELLKSKKLIKATLLSPYDSTDNRSLADRYAEVYKLDDKWRKYTADGQKITFPSGGQNFSRLQDSLLQEITKRVLEGEFGIGKVDKKLGFFEVNAVMKDELLAKLFCERMIRQATDFYVRTKTSRLRGNVNRLESRADSIGRLLNSKTYSAAASNQTLLDLNPAYVTANAGVEVKERDKMVLSAIYSETVKNLEVSKSMLAQETPTVQVVDEPELPLKKNKLKFPITMVAGAFICLFLMGAYKLLMK